MTGSRRMRRLAAALAGMALFAGATAVPAAAAPGEYWVSELQLAKTWKITRGAGVTVAVVDSGVPPIATLKGRLLPGVDLATGGPNGQRDTGESTPAGPASHGQQMAQDIAGDGSGGGTRGIAPDARILPVKVGTSSATLSRPGAGARGIRWAVDHGAGVVNLSFGVTGSCAPDEAAAVKYAYQHDVIVVASAGNQPGPVDTPANCPGALAVAGVEPNAAPWSPSAYGPSVDLANFADKIPAFTLDGHPVSSFGTSEAAAFTSGEIALLRARFPHSSARDIVTRLLRGMDTLSSKTAGTRVNDHVGYGLPVILSSLTLSVASTAPNPIYDAWAKELGPPTTSGSPAPASGGSAASGSSSGSDSGGIGALPIGIGVVVLVVIIGGIALLGARSRRRGAAGPPR